MRDVLTCTCERCPGRGTDGHGQNHCAECCMGTRVVNFDPACPLPEHRAWAIRQHGTAPTPAAAEPGTGTRDALAALYALADEWDTDMTAVRGGGVVSHHAAQLRTLAATLVPEPGTGTTARPPGPPGPPTATRAGVTYIYDVGSGYWLAPDGRKIRDLPPETPAALAALDALTGELDARTRAKQGLHYLEVVTLRNRLRDFAAALAPEVARIEAEAREAERERIAAKIEALLTTTGPKELARIVRSWP